MIIKNINTTFKVVFFASALVAAFCLFCIAGCSSDPMDPSELQSAEKVQMTLVTSGPQTRADYEGDGDVPSTSGDKMHFSWRSGDELSVYVVGVSADKNCKLGTKEKGKSAPFNGAVTPWDDAQKTIYAFYPFSTNGYTVTGSENSATATTSFTLPNPQTYTVGGAVSNSFMVGVGQAVTKGNAIDASASLKQVMSIIKLNIVNAPAKVIQVRLKCLEEMFPTTATVKLSDATISNPSAKVNSLTMVVNDGTAGTDKSVSLAMFPADLSGKTIIVDVAFEGGLIKSINKSGLAFERNTHYVMNFDATGAAIPEYYEINGIKWAWGNLVANGANSVKIGAPTDGGLYFQFGSLVGWSGGANGDGTGRTNSSDYPSLSAIVVPANYSGSVSWNTNWRGNVATDNPASLTGDPCRFYLKDNWRLPTKDELDRLIVQPSSFSYWKPRGQFIINNVFSNSSLAHPSGLELPASGFRYNGGIGNVNATGYIRSSMPDGATNDYHVTFEDNTCFFYSSPQYLGYPIRCVHD